MRKTIFMSLLCGALLIGFSACDKNNTEPPAEEIENGSENNGNPSDEQPNSENPNKMVASGTESGHDYVDMGLPSGTFWATCNVGATKPEEFGNYYAWGETSTKTEYTWDTYQYGEGISSLTKYCINASYGKDKFVDGKTSLDAEDDAARVNWGGKWRMPTNAELEELFDKTYCYYVWIDDFITTDDNSASKITGFLITSRKNGNSIFLPRAGYFSSSNVSHVGMYGYWSSELGKDLSGQAIFMRFDVSKPYCTANSRSNGQVVRAVFK